MQAVLHAADMQDRDGGVLLMGALFGLYPFLLKLYADSGYQGAKFRDGLAAVCAHVNVEIVKRSDLHRFVVLPKRWIVGSSSAPSARSTDAAGWPRIGNVSTAPACHSSVGLPSASCCESFASTQNDLGSTLRRKDEARRRVTQGRSAAMLPGIRAEKLGVPTSTPPQVGNDTSILADVPVRYDRRGQHAVHIRPVCHWLGRLSQQPIRVHH